ncbi:DUF1576 domain-containing protein [Ruminococcaceae bacterium OttesenSCG-928-A16]|nr:DUF1576 domain-containing protein [Ruminococcaceae bacterium OttesenSCG-928-A16]
MTFSKPKFYKPYTHALLTFAGFAIFAFVANSPAQIWDGLGKIITSRSLLITDYIALGGLGASLLNAAITGTASVLLMAFVRVEPNGSIIAAIWLTTGFSFFGKNIFNCVPIILGVWLYAKFQQENFSSFALTALLAPTLSPVVSEFAFLGRFNPWAELCIGCAVGIAVGFLVPIVAGVTTRVHGGYNLYNVGFAGGVISIFVAAFTTSAGIEIERPLLWSDDNNLFLCIFLCLLMGSLLIVGLLPSRRAANLRGYKKILRHSGRLVSDYYLLYGNAIYLNMGLLGLLATALTLTLGAPLNGVTLAGIFTITGFGAFGKHPANCWPVVLGAIGMALFNTQPLASPSNICAILFCTGLAPIAGQYGWVWGCIAGALHTLIVGHVGTVTSGFNLYSNGFAAGFVALVLVPIILSFKRGKSIRETEI